MSQCGGTGLMSHQSYRCFRYGVMFYRTSEVSGTGIHVVPIPVPNTLESSVKYNPVPDTSVRSVWHQPGTTTLWHQNKADSYAIRFRASDFYFSIWWMDRSSYAVRYCTIRWDKIWFENPMAQVRFWPKVWRLGPSDSQLRNDICLFVKQKRNCKSLRRAWYSSSARYTQIYEYWSMRWTTNTITMRKRSLHASPQPDYS